MMQRSLVPISLLGVEPPDNQEYLVHVWEIHFCHGGVIYLGTYLFLTSSNTLIHICYLILALR